MDIEESNNEDEDDSDSDNYMPQKLNAMNNSEL